MGVVEVEVEEAEAQEEEVDQEVALEGEEVVEVGVVEELVRTMQIIPMPRGSLPVETRSLLLQQS